MDLSDDEQILTVNNSDDNRTVRGLRGYKLKNALEIPVCLMFLGVSLGGAAIGNLIMYRTCVHVLDHPVSECRSFLDPQSIDHPPELEKQVQEYATMVGTVKSVLEALGPAILSLFIGGWSDKHGRKPLLVWPLLGMTICSMSTVVYSMLIHLGPWWIVPTVLPFSISGGYCAMVIAAMCYVSDITSEENRSFSLMIIQAVIAMSTALGGIASSYLLKAIGTVYLLLVQATLFTAAYAFTNVFIEESMRNIEPGSILTVFDLSHAKDMARTCFKKKPDYGRAIMLLIIGASTLSVFTIFGSTALTYMFTRTKLLWTMKDYTTFMAISSVMWFGGSFFGIAYLQKKLHISDLAFCSIAFLSCIIEYIIKAFATQTWQMYLGSTISLFGTISGPLLRSFLTKCVAPEEIAKVFGFMGAADAVMPLVSPLVYNSLYAATIFTFPGAIMLLTVFVNVLCLLCTLSVQYLRRKVRLASGYQSIDTDES